MDRTELERLIEEYVSACVVEEDWPKADVIERKRTAKLRLDTALDELFEELDYPDEP